MKIFNFRWINILIVILATSGIAACSPKISQIRDTEVSEPPSVLRLTSIEVVDLPESTQILLEGEGVLQYTSFTLSDPPRLVVDLSEISLGRFKEPIKVNQGSVIGIYPLETDMPVRVARLDIRLIDESIESTIYRRENALVIDVPKIPVISEFMSELPTEVLPEPSPELSKDVPEEAQAQVEIQGEEALPPPQELGVDKQEAESPPDRSLPDKSGNHIMSPKEQIEVEEESKEAGQSIEEKAPRVEIIEPVKGAKKQQDMLNVIRDIKIVPPDKKSDSKTDITIIADRDIDARTFMLDGDKIVIDVMDATHSIPSSEIPVSNNKSISKIRIGLHTTPVKKVRIVADVKDKITYNVIKEGKILTVSVHGKAVASMAKATTNADTVTEPANKPTGVTPAIVPKYTGKRVSLDFQDADIVNVLRLLGEVSKLNMVIGDNVKGKVTIKMVDVPWDQALDVIQRTKGLGKIYEDNVIRIDTLANISQQQEEEAKAKEAMVKAEDLVIKIFPVNYAKARDISESIKKVLSARGDITVDDRTNTMIVKDIKDKHEEISHLLKTLDKPTPQVLIEARIVQADSNFARDLGIQWGGDYSSNPGDYNIGIVTGPGGTTIGSPTTGFAVNLPATGVAGSKGSIGFTFGKTVGDAFNLDLRLSAGETKGLTKVLSAPKIATLDNREAVIQQGESIPYKTVSQEGTKTEFIDATLTLKVTPKVTPDGHIAMNIKISKNRQGSIVVEGTPSINKKEATTEVLVKDGETTVIGGIYETTDQDNVSGVPWFYKVPVFGWLFKNTSKSNIKSELLIFITPKIIPTTT